MIILRKLNNQEIIINSQQIECVEVIPESKIIMMNGKFYIVQESTEEIIDKVKEYNASVSALSQRILFMEG